MSNSGRLAGKRVLVTAAGQGIGLASTLAMANEGAQVYATDVNMDALIELDEMNIANIEIFKLDALSNDSIKEGVAKANPDVLFNCAGFVHHGSVLDCTDVNGTSLLT